VASNTKAMPQDEYQRRLIAYKELNQDFSAKGINNVSLSDLEPSAILELRKLLKSSGRFKVNIDKLTDEQLLKDLQLLRNDKLTIASMVLLGKESSLTNYMPYVEIRYSYRLNEGDSRTQDIEIFNGGYLSYYNNLWNKINSRNLKISVPQGLLIREVNAFDEESIREAINNAMIHRDYSLNESIFITQYQDKIEIKSPGGFVDSVTIDNILDESKTRNKLIADTLFKTEFVEHLGNGVNLMFKNQLSRGKTPPNYSRTTPNNVLLELDGKIKDVEFAKYVFNIANEKNRDLSDRELLVLNKIKDGKRVTSSYITDNLLNTGLIEKIGYGKYILSRNYYDDTGKLGEYTRSRGLSKEENKMLLLKHLDKFEKGFKKDLMQVLPSLKDYELYRLLVELREEGKIEFIGNRRSHSGDKAGYWKLVNKLQ
jgi:ATP-dependent DNA helicase RecG